MALCQPSHLFYDSLGYLVNLPACPQNDPLPDALPTALVPCLITLAFSPIAEQTEKVQRGQGDNDIFEELEHRPLRRLSAEC